MPKMSGAQFMADALHAYGVTHIFFVPTILSHSLAQMDERGTNIARVLTHGEKAAAYMADGYARASGRPGVCMAQIVGGVNLAAGLRDAHLACTPLIAFTGGTTPKNPLPERLPGNRGHQRVRPGDEVQRHGRMTSSVFPICSDRPSASPPRERRGRCTCASAGT